jgi:anti-sigma regulatory factor (Ser/Thr protein kinase)
MRKTKKKIEFSSHTGNLALMRNCVRHFLEAFPFSERQRTLMVLGVDEACSNIIRHAYHLRDDQFISSRSRARMIASVFACATTGSNRSLNR